MGPESMEFDSKAINSNRKCWIYTLLTIPMYQFLHRSLRRWLFAVEPFDVEVTMYRRCVRCVTSRCPQRCGFFSVEHFHAEVTRPERCGRCATSLRWMSIVCSFSKQPLGVSWIGGAPTPSGGFTFAQKKTTRKQNKDTQLMMHGICTL